MLENEVTAHPPVEATITPSVAASCTWDKGANKVKTCLLMRDEGSVSGVWQAAVIC